MVGTRRHNFQPAISTLSATVHSFSDRQTDGRTDGWQMMPRADPTACSSTIS